MTTHRSSSACYALPGPLVLCGGFLISACYFWCDGLGRNLPLSTHIRPGEVIIQHNLKLNYNTICTLGKVTNRSGEYLSLFYSWYIYRWVIICYPGPRFPETQKASKGTTQPPQRWNNSLAHPMEAQLGKAASNTPALSPTQSERAMQALL